MNAAALIVRELRAESRRAANYWLRVLVVRQLLNGRFWGVCCHYLPALGTPWVGWSGGRLLNASFGLVNG